MKRLGLAIACLSAVAWTQASAQDLSTDPVKAHPDPMQRRRSAPPPRRRQVSTSFTFSDPYAPPEHNGRQEERSSWLFVRDADGAARRPVNQYGSGSGRPYHRRTEVAASTRVISRS